MRDIGSNRITGPEAILVSSIVWWLSTKNGIHQSILESLEKADPILFTSRIDLDLGRSLSSIFPVDDLIDDYWNAVKSNPALKNMVEQATLAQRADKLPDKIKISRSFVEKVILSEFGSYVKESGFLERNAALIRRAKRRKKKV